MCSHRAMQEQVPASHQRLRDDNYQALEFSLLQLKSILNTPRSSDIPTQTKIPIQRQGAPRSPLLSLLKKRDDEVVRTAYSNLAESISQMKQMMRSINMKQVDREDKRDDELTCTYHDLAGNIQSMRQMFKHIKGSGLVETYDIEKQDRKILNINYGDLERNISEMKQMFSSLKYTGFTGIGSDQTEKKDRELLAVNYHDLEENISTIKELLISLKQKGIWTDEAEKIGQEVLADHYEDLEENIGNLKEMLNSFINKEKGCIGADEAENQDDKLMEKTYSNLAENIDEIMLMLKNIHQKDLISSTYDEIEENISQITEMFHSMKENGLMSWKETEKNVSSSENQEDNESKEWKVIDKISQNIDQQFNRFYETVKQVSEDENSSESSFKIVCNPKIKISQANKIQQQIGEMTFLQENQYRIATDFQLIETLSEKLEPQIQPLISQQKSQDLSSQHQKLQLQSQKSPSQIENQLQLNFQGLSEVKQPHFNSSGDSMNNAIESENLYSESGNITDRSMILKRNNILNKYEGESSIYFNEESVPVGKYFEAIQQKQKQKEALKNYEEQRQNFEELKKQQDESMKKLSQQLEQYKTLYQGQKLEAQKNIVEAQRIYELYSNHLTYTSDLTNNYENRIAYLTETIEKKQAEIKAANQQENEKTQELYDQIESLKNKIVEEQQENEQVSTSQQRQFEALNQQYINTRNMMMMIESQNNCLKKENDDLLQKIQELEAKNTNLYSAIENFQHKNAQDTQDEIDEVYTFQYSKVIQQLENAKKQLGQQQFQNQNLSHTLKRMHQQIQAKDQQINILQQKLQYESSKKQPIIQLQAAIEQQMASLRRQNICQLRELEIKERQIDHLHDVIETIIKKNRLSIDIVSLLEEQKMSKQSNRYARKLQEYSEIVEHLMNEKKEIFESLQNSILSEMREAQQSQQNINKIKSILKYYQDAPQKKYQGKRDKFDTIRLFQVETAQNTKHISNDSAIAYRRSRILHPKFSQIKLVKVESKSPKSGKIKNVGADEVLQIKSGNIVAKDQLNTEEDGSQNEDTLDLSGKQPESQQVAITEQNS